MTDDKSRYRISDKLRRNLCMEFFYQYIGIALFFSACLVADIPLDYLWVIGSIVLYGAVGISVLLIIRGYRVWRHEEGFRFEYELDETGIRQFRPSGALREARWQDLQQVSENGCVLHFKPDNAPPVGIIVDSLLANSPSPFVAAILEHIERADKKPLINKLFQKGQAQIANSHRTPRWRWHCYAQAPSIIICVSWFFVSWETHEDQTGRWIFLGLGVALSIIGASAVEFLWRRNLKALREFERTHSESLPKPPQDNPNNPE